MTDYREMNQKKIADYFRAGCKPSQSRLLGVEVEHFIASPSGNASYEQVIKGLEYMRREQDRWYLVEGGKMGFYNPVFSLTLEPAAQLEISIFPRESVEEIEEIYKDFRKRAQEAFARLGFEIHALSYQPFAKARELPLIPKKRYEFMDRYFQEKGTGGIFMMRGSASTQVSVDYYSEADCVRKYRLAARLAPLLSLYSENGGIFEGKPFKGHLVRTYIWNHVDDCRCNVVPGCFEPDFGFDAYARYLYHLPLILTAKQGKAVYVGEKCGAQLYREREITVEEIQHMISMTFVDVRLKNYLELRMADSMEEKEMLDYVKLVRNIFYSESAMALLEGRLGEPGEEAIAQAKEALIKEGKEARVYGRPAGEWLEMLRKLG